MEGPTIGYPRAMVIHLQLTIINQHISDPTCPLSLVTYNASLALAAVMTPWWFIFMACLAVSRPVRQLLYFKGLLSGWIRTLKGERQRPQDQERTPPEVPSFQLTQPEGTCPGSVVTQR